MINHFRTILLNRTGPSDPMDLVTPSDVYIPEYTQKYIPLSLQDINHLLFGDCLTDADLSRKAYQLLKVVHGSDLRAEITAKDSRLTYDISEDIAFGEYQTSTTLMHSIEFLATVGQAKLEYLFDSDEVLIRQYTHGKTYIDRLSAVIVAYVRKLESL